jgi:hypothetical protein
MLWSAFVAAQANLLASHFYHPLDSFCDAWEDQETYDCTECDTGGGFPPGFGADGSCDFSGIEDEEERLQTAAAYLQDSVFACDDSCDGDYAEYVADWYRDFGNPFDPCFDAQKDPECWFTWGQGGGQAGSQSTWSCGCERFFFCAC